MNKKINRKIERLEQRVRELERALLPFTNFADNPKDHDRSVHTICLPEDEKRSCIWLYVGIPNSLTGHHLMVEDLKRAKKTLNKKI